jgi:RNA polymerase sigma factor (TIGR02999 family)
MADVTHILSAIEQGDAHAAEPQLPLVYDELRRFAAQRLAQEEPGQTRQPTALVREAYQRLVDEQARHWDRRGTFFAAAAEAMRRILVENARRKKRGKRGGQRKRLTLEDRDVPVQPPADDVLALDEALTRLAETDPEEARVVQLNFFAGLPIEQVAETLGVSRATAYRQ